MKGIFDQDKSILSGTFTISDDLQDTILIDKINPEKNTFRLTGYEC